MLSLPLSQRTSVSEILTHACEPLLEEPLPDELLPELPFDEPLLPDDPESDPDDEPCDELGAELEPELDA